MRDEFGADESEFFEGVECAFHAVSGPSDFVGGSLHAQGLEVLVGVRVEPQHEAEHAVGEPVIGEPVSGDADVAAASSGRGHGFLSGGATGKLHPLA